MFVRQWYNEFLNVSAYYVESNGVAAVIDPLRDIQPYLALASERGSAIRYIFETHFHADFVSGHLDLAHATGADIVFGPQAHTRLPVTIATDGQLFQLGEVSMEVIHTPGHTAESTCYLLRDESGDPYALFTGDTLLANGAGRPEILPGSNATAAEMAGQLYNSLQNRILVWPDTVLVYPTHGSGLPPITSSTLGEVRQTADWLTSPDEEEFLQRVNSDKAGPPAYYAINARINKEGYEMMKKLLDQGLVALSPERLKELAAEGAIVLDTRPATEFTSGFIPGSISIGLEGRFAEWAGSLLPFDSRLILVTEPGREEESLVRLAHVGFQHFAGYLEGGIGAWMDAGETADLIIDVEADELAMDLPFDPHLIVLDVRRETEFADGHIRGALNMPLAELNDPANMAAIEDHHNVYLHCSVGYRSVIAASLLKRQGIHNIRNVLGGWKNITGQDRQIEVVKEGSVLN